MEKQVWKSACDAKSEILKFESRIDLLHDVLGFGRFAEIYEDPAGIFLGRRPGDIGFNEFLGQPSEAAKQRTKELYSKLSKCAQEQVMMMLRSRSINPKDLGIG